MVVLPASDAECRVHDAMSAIEAAIANLAIGETGTALDEILAARLFLAASLDLPRSVAEGQRPGRSHP